MRVGRPAKVNNDLFTQKILDYKDKIITAKGTIISKCDSVWITIAKELDHIITPASLYTFVTCNKYNIRDKLMNRFPPATLPEDNVIENVLEETYVSGDSSANTTKSLNVSTASTFTITMPKEEFMSLIMRKVYRRRDKGKPESIREYTILRSGMWQHVFNEKIWAATKITCGFNFKNHKLLRSGEYGYANGTCKCGAVIKCDIDNSIANDLTTKISCTFIEGKGRCGKRYLRRPIRDNIAEKLKKTTAMAYRTELAENLMSTSDTAEPPHLFTTNVLRVAKKKIIEEDYLDKDPLKALLLMQLGSLRDIIHNIGLNPFFTHYWSNYQINVYRSYAMSEPACIYIDATGSIIKKIKRPDQSKSKHIFLYNSVINCESSGLFPVCQMLSESHNTNAIQFWLSEWIRLGAPRPQEVVCDFSRALLTAAIRCFAGHLTLEGYSDACKDDQLPMCYIRIDVAHFIKKYSNFLKNARPRIKKFYLSLLGQLILCRNVEIAEEILTSLLVISRSETEGNTQQNKPTMCEEHKMKVKRLFMSDDAETQFLETEDSNSDDNEDHEDVTNGWYHWAKSIDEKVRMKITDTGDRENAHYMPAFADKLIADTKYLPLWSCICRDKFGFGRIPASSASVEGDFHIIKNIFLKNEQTPMRADLFITKHVKFLSGRVKLINAMFQEKDSGETETAETIEKNIEEFPTTVISEQFPKNDNINVEINVECPVCANGDEPTGAHVCNICHKSVHAIDACSTPIGEEGYGQKRICKKCETFGNANEILATREIEDWRGLASKTSSRGRYLQRGNPEQDFLLNKLQKIPIIKNGGNLSVKAVKIGNEKYSFTNTCAFDSILQLFISAYFDKKYIKDLIHKESSNMFFKLVLDIVTHGIKKSSYRLRALILREIFKSSNLRNDCALINCEVTVAFLCRELFQKYPSFKEISSCSCGCPTREKILPLVQVELGLLQRKEFNRIESEITIQGIRPCCQRDCNGFETTTISYIGQFIIFELYSENTDEQRIPLEELPTELNLSFLEQAYSLVGTINFKSPVIQTRQSIDSDIGHYTAICYRKNNKWVRYDDCKDAEKVLDNHYNACPHIVIYCK